MTSNQLSNHKLTPLTRHTQASNDASSANYISLRSPENYIVNVDSTLRSSTVAVEAALLALADADVAVGAAEREVEGAEPLHEGLAPCHHVLHNRIPVAGGL